MSLCFKQGSERRATPSYTLEDAFELVPGNWVFEIWQGNRKLAEFQNRRRDFQSRKRIQRV